MSKTPCHFSQARPSNCREERLFSREEEAVYLFLFAYLEIKPRILRRDCSYLLVVRVPSTSLDTSRITDHSPIIPAIPSPAYAR